jgi:Transposase DDE domain
MVIINESKNTFTNPVADVSFSMLLGSIATLPKPGPRTNGMSHRDFILSGVLRPLMEAKSGRDALQSWKQGYCDLFDKPDFVRSTWFNALHADSRLKAVVTVGCTFRCTAAPLLPDRLAAFPELALYDVWTGDGHWHEASLHDECFLNKKCDLVKLPAGHIYFYNVRSGLLVHFATCEPGTQEHDMSVLKRKPLDFLLENAENESQETGSKPAPKTKTPKTKGAKRTFLVVYDRAAIDFRFWNKKKRTKGVRLITRMKAGLLFAPGKLLTWDQNNPINARIISDELVMKDGEPWRRIETFRADKSSGETIIILTNDLELPPGIICELYHRRWDIERTYDDLKHKFDEKQAWASSQIAKSMQGEFITLAWNVIQVLEHELEKQGVANIAEENRRTERTAAREEQVAKATRQAQKQLDDSRREALEMSGLKGSKAKKVSALIRITVVKESPELYKAREIKIPVKLLRWLRDMLRNSWSWDKMLECLKDLYRNL